MKSILITGGFGFVGQELIKKLLDTNEYTVFVTKRNLTFPIQIEENIEVFEGDLRNSRFVTEVISTCKPDYIIHLAAESSVAYSWKEPNLSFQNNVNIYLNLLEAVRKTSEKTRILSIGSSEEYGIVDETNIPISEDVRTNPISPYAVARQAQSNLSKVYSEGFSLDIVSTRSFNHYGENQSNRFVIPSFIEKVLNQKFNGNSQSIEVGNLNIVRDFIHVGDVVNAYIALLRYGQSGEIYNVCGGIGRSLKEILVLIYELVGIPPNYDTVKALIRPNDNPVIIGNNEKIKSVTGWQPIRNFQKEIREMVLKSQSKFTA